MIPPITNGNIRINQEVMTYEGTERRRLCLQRVEGGAWEVRLATENEAQGGSWHTQNSRVIAGVSRLFSTYVLRSPSPVPNRIVLDAHLQVSEERDMVQIRWNETPSDLMSRLGLSSASRSELAANAPGERMRIIRDGLRQLNLYQSVFTPQAIEELRQQQPQPAARPAQRTASRPLYLNIRTDRLKDHPADILEHINREFARQEGDGINFNTLNIVYFNENGTRDPGIDAGGLSRDFMTKFFAELARPGGEARLPNFSFETRSGESGSVFPIASSRREDGTSFLSDEGGRDLNNIGRLIGICFQNPDLLTGQVFDPAFFGALNSLSPDEAVRLIDHDPTPAILSKLFIALNPDDFLIRNRNPEALSDQDLIGLLYAVYSDGIPENPFGDGADPKVIRENMPVLKAAIKNCIETDRAPTNPRVQAVLKIVGGMATQIGRRGWTQISRQNPAEIEGTIQGRLTKELFLHQIRSRVNNATARDYLIRWAEANPLERISQLVFLMTGSSSLGQRPLNFRVDPEDTTHLPAYHTCDRTMDLPVHPSYEEFSQKLEKSMENALAEKGMTDQ